MSTSSTASDAAGPIARRLSGLHAALLTPYDADGNVSDGCLRRLVAHVRAQGIEGLYVGGSTGEGLLQSTEERLAIFAAVAEAAEGSTLIGQVGAIGTREAQRLAKGCAALGYHAVSAIPPIYFPHRKDAIIGYYRDVVEAAGGLPLLVYNIPAMSGVTLSLDDLARLLELPNVVGIKQTNPNMYQMEQLHRLFPGAVLLNGYDEMLLAGLVSGASGGIGSTYNVMGRKYLALVARLRAGDVAAASGLQSECNAVIDELVKVGVFPGLKYLLYRQGVIATPVCRRPLDTLSAATSGRLDEVARRLASAEAR